MIRRSSATRTCSTSSPTRARTRAAGCSSGPAESQAPLLLMGDCFSARKRMRRQGRRQPRPLAVLARRLRGETPADRLRQGQLRGLRDDARGQTLRLASSSPARARSSSSMTSTASPAFLPQGTRRKRRRRQGRHRRFQPPGQLPQCGRCGVSSNTRICARRWAATSPAFATRGSRGSRRRTNSAAAEPSSPGRSSRKQP